MPPLGKKSPSNDYRTDAARSDWAAFQKYAGDDAKGVEFHLKWLREKLTAANADASALDATGQKTAAQMEAEIGAATKAAWLRTARKIWSEYPAQTSDSPEFAVEYSLKNIRECLQKAGAGLEELDPDNLNTAAAVEKAMAAGAKKIYLGSARKCFKAFEANKFGHEMSSTDYTCRNIRSWAKKSGEGFEALIAPEDLPPELQGASAAELRQHAEDRLDKARRHSALLCARRLFADFEGPSPVHADQIDWAVERIFTELAFSRHEKQDLDPTGQSTAEDIDRRLAEASKRCYRRSAEREIKDFLDRSWPEDGPAVYFMDKIRRFLDNAGESAASLGMTGKYAPEILEEKFADLDPKAARCRAMSALDHFEKCPVPASVAEVVATGRRVTELFNLAAADFAREFPDDPEFRDKIDLRINAAAGRARGFYYSFNGLVPVLKPLHFVTPETPRAPKPLRFKTPASS